MSYLSLSHCHCLYCVHLLSDPHTFELLGTFLRQSTWCSGARSCRSPALRCRSLKWSLTMQIPREKVWRASELYLSLVLIHFLPGTPTPPPARYIKPTGFHVGVSSYSHSVVKAPAHRHDMFEMPVRYLFPLSSLLLYVHVHAIGGTREIIAVLGSVLTSVYFTLRLCCFGICWKLAP